MVMRVFFPLAALLAGAQALSSSLYQKRAGVDICANVGCSVALPSPLTGKSIAFGDIGEITPVAPFFLPDRSAQRVFLVSFGRRVCVSLRNSRPRQVQPCPYRGFSGRWQIEGHGLHYWSSESATILHTTDPPLDRIPIAAITDVPRHHRHFSTSVGKERGKQLQLPRSRDPGLLQG